MQLIILARDLTLSYLRLEDANDFGPNDDLIGQPLAAAQVLLARDPGLPDACRKVLSGATVLPVEIGAPDAAESLRRIAPRFDAGGQLSELIVTYEPGPASPQAELTRLRKGLAQAVEAQMDAIGYFDADDRLILCNHAFANLHPGPEGPLTIGMTFEEILRRNLRHGGINIAKEAQEDWVASRLSERAEPYLTREIQQRDGRWFRLIERGTLGGGRMHLLIDITELKMLEQRFQGVIAGAAFGTWSVDLATGTADLDERSAAMLGYAPDDITPLTRDHWESLIHPEDKDRVISHYAAYLVSDRDTPLIDYRIRHADGHYIWLQARGGVSSTHPDGRPRTLSGIQIDITRQKTVEADLYLRGVAITASHDGIIITDTDGIIRDANPAAAKMLGHDDARPLIGRAWQDGFTAETVEILTKQMNTTVASQGVWLGDAMALTATGVVVEQELSLTRMPDGRMVWITRDVRARNALARERLELRDAVNRAQRQEIINLLAAGLTHDLSNLTALISHLSDPAARGFSQNGTAVMDEIHAAARQMVSLLEPIGQLGRRVSQRINTDLADLVSEAAGILHLGAPADLAVNTRLPADPVIAELDPMQVMQVLLNLGLNARDALGDGPQSIELALSLADRLPLDAELQTGRIPDPPFALITISDSGSGIPPHLRSQIWEPFFTTKKLRGTGLGLFVVADIVRSAGGAIALTSQIDQGTAFHIAWPLISTPSDDPET